jgi:hypothetical protein
MQGADIALSLLSALVESRKKQWLKDEASLLLQEVADARALTREALEDERRIDPNTLTAAERARALSDATEHMRRMMFEERRIPLSRFQAHFVSDVLRGPLVRGIIWGSFEDGRLQATFRIAEDGTFASIDDTAFAPPESALVGPVHVLHLAEAERAIWRARFGDYQIITAIGQLTERHAHSLAEACARVEGKAAGTQALFALRGRGWRAHASGAGVEFLERIVGDARFVLGARPPLTQKDAQHELVLSCVGEASPGAVQLDLILVDIERLLGDTP